ncbi:UNVERIFIED_CONTAM: hypothetical protein FKN15_054235 [Acipenser sinensis]
MALTLSWLREAKPAGTVSLHQTSAELRRTPAGLASCQPVARGAPGCKEAICSVVGSDGGPQFSLTVVESCCSEGKKIGFGTYMI